MTTSTSAPEDLTQDGSLLKTVLQEGDGAPPGRGSRVTVQYSLRLSDDLTTPPFDSSAKRKDGVLTFTLGRKKVIPALELVAQSMKPGERAVTRCTAPYAFGAKGLKRKGVPGGATVFLEVEMVEVQGEERKNLADMSPLERFEEAKEFKEKGNTMFREHKYDRALQMYSQSIRLLSNVFYKPSGSVREAVVKNVEVNGKADESGFEEAVVEGSEDRKMEGGSRSVENGQGKANSEEVKEKQAEVKGAKVSAEQHKDSGTNGKVAGSNIGEEEEVVETIDVSTAQGEAVDASSKAMSDDANGTKKEESSATNPNGDIDKTAKQDADKSGVSQEAGISGKLDGEKHHDALNANGDSTLGNDPEEKEVKSLHVTTLNNLSLCFVKLENYKQAVESATLALKIDPQSSKALYYRGRARIALGEWDMARADLVAADKIQPKNPGIRNEIIKLDRKVKQFEQREKKQAAAMFA